MMPQFMHLYNSSKSIYELSNIVNQELETLGNWVNVGKTNYIIFSKRIKQSNISIKINGREIERKRYIKFLAIVVDETLRWDEHIKNVKAKIVSALFALISARRYLNNDIMRTLYYSLVYPHFTYGILLWCTTYRTYLNQIQLLQKAICIVANANKWIEHTMPLLKQFHILPLVNTYDYLLGNFMYRQINRFKLIASFYYSRNLI